LQNYSALTIVVAHKNLSQIIDSSALTIVVAHKNLSQIIDSSALTIVVAHKTFLKSLILALEQ
jgi:hypothetical protein